MVKFEMILFLLKPFNNLRWKLANVRANRKLYEFHIDKYFRFDGKIDPTDEWILYAVSSKKYNLKVVLINGYGISSKTLTG